MKTDWPKPLDRYVNICSDCKTQFAGPKRALACWSCITDEHREQMLDYINRNDITRSLSP